MAIHGKRDNPQVLNDESQTTSIDPKKKIKMCNILAKSDKDCLLQHFLKVQFSKTKQ